MKTSKMKESKFLTKDDVDPPVLVTMGQVERFDVALAGAGPEYKWALHFDEMDKPMILNQTNINIINAVTGTDDTDNWIGKKIVLYNDPSIAYAGKVTGGIRVRGNQVVQAPVVPNQKPVGNHEFQVENKNNEADNLMTYNSIPKPTAAQIANIRKICIGVWADTKCEIKNRLDIWSYFGSSKWPDSDEEVQKCIEESCMPF
jgi:hypothetical protein